MNHSKWKNVKEAFSYARKIFLRKRTKHEYSDALDAMEYCAIENDPIAQYQLYALKLNDSKAEVSKEAINWCIKSAENNYPPAQYDLALHYLYGDGIDQDAYKAVFWMEKSASAGYQEAARKLVTLYRAGTKIRKNPSRADFWSEIADNPELAEDRKPYDLSREMLEIPSEQEKKQAEPIRVWATYADLFQPVAQEYVITAPRDKNFVINAGPGTGKTYALIQRINHLVSDEGVEADQIVVLSFTNAVVKEVKERLAQAAEEAGGDRYIRNTDVRTFHSLAYQMLQYANSCVSEEDPDWEDWKEVDLSFSKISYDDCMVKGAELIKAHPEMVTPWEYFVVDEIQDINHGKAEFVLGLLRACILNNIPFMFLGDSCQAIYDYLDKQNTAGESMTSEEFYQEVIQLAQGKAQFCSFQVNHRSVAKIQKQTAPIRDLILNAEQSFFPAAIGELADSCQKVELQNIRSFAKNHPDKTICLMARNNISTKRLSAELIKKGIVHNSVLAVHKDAYPRWIGTLLGGYDEAYLSRDKFVSLCEHNGISGEKGNDLWNQILEEHQYSSEVMLMDSFVMSLRSHDLDFLIEEKQERKQITVSNIHRSKGLEYDYVCLDEQFLEKPDKDMEEMRTLYVAITRPKQELMSLTNTGMVSGISRDKKKRSRKHVKKNKVKMLRYIEILDSQDLGDVTPACFVIENMEESQKVIQSLHANDPIVLDYDSSKERYSIVANDTVIGWMPDSFTRSVRFGHEGEMPIRFDDIYIDGVFSYIGGQTEYRKRYEKEAMRVAPAYGKYCIWNYVAFSGLARAMYPEDKRSKNLIISHGNTTASGKKK